MRNQNTIIMTAQTEENKKAAVRSFIPLAILMLGIALLVFCIVVEDEPGGVSLLLIVIGAVWYVIQRVQRSRKAKS